MKGKTSFIEHYVRGNDNILVDKVETMITTMVVGVAKENTRGRTRSKFMRGIRGEIRIAKASGNPKMRVVNGLLKKLSVRDFILNG